MEVVVYEHRNNRLVSVYNTRRRFTYLGVEKMKYKTKPQIVDAIQYNGNFNAIEKFVGGDCEFRNGVLFVATAYGVLNIGVGDYMVKTKHDSFVMYPELNFLKKYEAIE